MSKAIEEMLRLSSQVMKKWLKIKVSSRILIFTSCCFPAYGLLWIIWLSLCISAPPTHCDNFVQQAKQWLLNLLHLLRLLRLSLSIVCSICCLILSGSCKLSLCYVFNILLTCTSLYCLSLSLPLLTSFSLLLFTWLPLSLSIHLSRIWILLYGFFLWDLYSVFLLLVIFLPSKVDYNEWQNIWDNLYVLYALCAGTHRKLLLI